METKASIQSRGLLQSLPLALLALNLFCPPAFLKAGEDPAGETPGPSGGKASLQGAGKVILVASFENHSKVRDMITYEVGAGNDPKHPKRRFHVDRYSEAPRGILEDLLTGYPGITIVERQRVDSMLQEIELGDKSFLVDQDTAVQIGKMLGANTIIMGTILEIGEETSEFKGYGVKTKLEIMTASVRVRAIDILSGTVTISKTFKAQEKYTGSQFGKRKRKDPAYAVLEAALEKLKEDKAFLDALAGKNSEKAVPGIAVSFTPSPENCDVLIDGEYQGGSPLTLSLPTGKAVKVQIRKAGYQPWEGSITPREGIRPVKPELMRSGPEKKAE